MSEFVLMCCPGMGERYGFPKEIPYKMEGKELHEWLKSNGFPEELIDLYSYNLHIRYWRQKKGVKYG
jgi:hypothetical protein